MTLVTRFSPGRVFGPDGTSTFAGPVIAGKTCGAWMKPESHCPDCGQQLRSGELVAARLIRDWGSAQWRHEDECPQRRCNWTCSTPQNDLRVNRTT